MLYTRNASFFRKFYKDEVAREKGWLDLNYVGSLHPDKNRTETGFAKLIYGNREDLGKLLGTIALNVAADDQAIYELIQNADDCKSSFFSVSYNEEYLLCINNGNYFSDQDMSAIINVAGNYKDGEDIGTFGIGFKILHRLVGADDGREAIINDYAGPIIFSWNKYAQLIKFIEGEPIWVTGLGKARENYEYERDKENPWLVKILYTCFPCNYNEPIRLRDYETRDVRFDEKELDEMREFLRNSLQNVNLTEDNYLKSGSIFFLRLGKGKSKFLDDGIDKIKSGLSYSFKFLNSLQKIYIKDEEIKAQDVIDYSNSFLIDSPEFTEINPKNKKRDIKFTLAYYKDYKQAENLRNELVPNLYTFFSMDEEKNGFNFLLHCNAFDMNNDRRKLQANSQINEKLLPAIANSFMQYIDYQKENSRYHFLSLYANLLLSKEPKGKPHVYNYFFSYLKKYISQNLPTSEGYSENTQNVKIKDTFLRINPSDIGCSQVQWFYWYNEKEDGELIDEARNQNKLALEKWDIIDLFRYAIQKGKLEDVNNWIKQIELETSNLFAEERELKRNNSAKEVFKKRKPYLLLLSEINKNISKSSFEVAAQINFFKFSDDKFYSLNDIFSNADLILNYEKTFDIRYELQLIGFKVSYINIDNYANIKELVDNKIDELRIFQQIALKIKHNQLRKDQKHKLFFTLSNFHGVGEEKLKDLELFKNSKGVVQALRGLIKADLPVPRWLFNFKVHIAEYSSELDKYLVDLNKIYREIILPNWEIINSEISNISEFYTKVRFYYEQDETNAPLKNQNFIFINPETGFLSPKNNFFYNPKIKEIETLYEYFQNSIQSLLGLDIPDKRILVHFETEPFKIEKSNFFDWEIIENKVLSFEEIKAVLLFCKLNNEQFFKKCIIKKDSVGFTIINKTAEKHQITSPDENARKFIAKNCADKLFILAVEFLEYKEEDGIVKADDLHSLILDSVDVNQHKEELVGIVRYSAKLKFLQKLSNVHLSEIVEYKKESYEYKVLELACSEIINYVDFRQKITIEINNKRIKLTEIQPFVDKITIDNVDLQLSEIVPEIYQDSRILSIITEKLVQQGLPQDKLKSLFGINNTPSLSHIFNVLLKQVNLINWQQLCFVYHYYSKNNNSIDVFKIKAINGLFYSLAQPLYLNHFSFIHDYRKLSDEYSEIKNHITCPNQYFLNEPYFTRTEFKCPFIKQELTTEQRKDFIEFLYQQWVNHDKKSVIRSIDWSKIGDYLSRQVIGFNPTHTVYPNEFAFKSEVIPEYLTEWIRDNENKINFISDLGVWTDNSVIVELRKFWIGKSDSFNKTLLVQERKFNTDGTVLRQSFLWLIEQQKELDKQKHWESFETVVKILNPVFGLSITSTFDYRSIGENSTEWDDNRYASWKLNSRNRFSIYLHSGSLPKLVRLGGLSFNPNYVFIRYFEDNRLYTNNYIYINRNANIKDELHGIALDSETPFSLDHLWQLFSGDSDRVKELSEKVAHLESQLLQKPNAQLDAGYDNSISKNDQIEANREAKEIVKERLEKEGFSFTQGINGFSTIDGVVKDGVEFPLVVKSYRWRDEPFKIGANEWLQLMKQNSMFWVHFGNRQLACLKLRELLRKQDKLTISFGTENLDMDDRLNKFAELLQFFNNVHFDFNSIKSENYSTAGTLSDYRFDERKVEEDLSGDNENIL